MSDRYRIADQSAIYFCTFTIIDWVDVFTRKEYCIILEDAMNYCIQNKGLICYAYVIMSNHVHVIWQAEDDASFSAILRDFKKYTSKQIIKAIQDINESRKVWMLRKFAFEAKRSGRAKYYKLWKDDNHAIELHNNYLMNQKLDYIHNNPVKAMRVSEPEHYHFSSAKNYAGDKGAVLVTLLE